MAENEDKIGETKKAEAKAAEAKLKVDEKAKTDVEAKAKAKEEAEAKAAEEAESIKGLVKMHKHGEHLHVHPTTVDAHTAAGWKVA